MSSISPQGIPSRNQGNASGRDAVAPPASGTPAVPAGNASAPANTRSSPSAGGGKWPYIVLQLQ